MCFQHKEHLYYKQMFSKFKDSFTVVELLLWIGENILLEEVKSGLRYVLTEDEFLQFHESLEYETNSPAEISPRMKELLEKING
jgi:hypothetical protein